MKRGGSEYLRGAQVQAAVDAAEDLIMLLEVAGLGSRHAEAGSGAGGDSEAGGLAGGGGGGGREVGEGGALHLLHAVVTTVVVMHLHGRNRACLHLQSVTSVHQVVTRGTCLLSGGLKGTAADTQKMPGLQEVALT